MDVDPSICIKIPILSPLPPLPEAVSVKTGPFVCKSLRYFNEVLK